MQQSESSVARRGAWWVRVLRTPLTDLLRGHVADGQTVRSVVAASALAPPLKELVSRVAQGTRLWPQEQIDVARELMAHFEDGANAGEVEGELVRRFGDAKEAAALIRRAKLRARPLGLRLLHGGRRIAALGLWGLLAFYVYLCVRFYSGTAQANPAPMAGLVASVNARFEGMPRSETAWPTYQAVDQELRQLFGNVSLDEDEEHESLWGVLEADSPHARALVALARKRGDLLPRLRAAAVLPELGFSLTLGEEHGDVLLGHLWVIRRLSRVLATDAALAIESDASSIVRENSLAVLNMAEHVVRSGPFTLCDLLGWSLMTQALDVILDALSTGDGLLTEEQLLALLGHLTALDFRLQVSGDEIYCRTLLTSIFSGTGETGGHLTVDGLDRLARHVSRPPESFWRWPTALRATLPLLLPSQESLLERFNVLFTQVRHELSRPLWSRSYPALYRWREALDGKAVSNVLYRLLPILPLDQDELMVQRRDAALCAIALVRHRRRAGHWAPGLEVLRPQFLRELPRDRFDGRTLRYRLIEGSPVLYSVGVDGDDDDGRVAKYAAAWQRFQQLEGPRTHSSYDGDWLLWRGPTDP